MTTNLTTLESQIRDRINARRKQLELLTRGADWNRLCSALDVIGDTELALASYLVHPLVEDIGTRYLHVYGALQLLQTQQDAVSELCLALQLRPAASPKVPLVRELRSSSIGHPTRQQENNKSKSNFIVRGTLSQRGFTLFTVTDGEWPHTERSVAIPRLIKLQHEALTKTLMEVIQTLDRAEMKHRDSHKAKKLTASFPETLGYYFSKIFEAIHSPTYYPLGRMHVDLISEALESLKQLLQERGEWDICDSIKYEYELLQYPIERLKTFFTEKTTSGCGDKDAFIYCTFIQQRVAKLQVIASEIDQQYDSAPSNDA